MVAKKVDTHKCVVCRKTFVTVRTDSKFCSAKCRHKHWRDSKKLDKVKRKNLIELQNAPALQRITDMCPELSEHFTTFKQRFDTEAFYVMISVIDYMLDKECIKQ